MKFRFEFPPEVEEARQQAFDMILCLLREDTLETIQEACRVQLAWLEVHPDDYAMYDIGEVLSKSHDAILATEPEPALVLSR